MPTSRVRSPRQQSKAICLAALSVVAVVTANASAQVRSIDGSGNNLLNLTYGQAGTNYTREASGAHYGDGVLTPNGANRPDARTLSNTLMNQGEGGVLDSRNLTAMVYTWGQFVDHDLDLRSDAVPTEALNINVPSTDIVFDPNGTGTQIIPMMRSAWDPTTGLTPLNPRQQVNNITSFIDASMVYGSDATRAAWLRTNSGGQLKSTPTPTGAMLPFNDGTQQVDGLTGPSHSTSLYVAGDTRANEQVGITSMQTLLMREHNRQATLIARQNPGWSDEQVYQRARAIVSGEVESITYNEFLPAMLGSGAMPAYAGYNASVNPGAGNAFAAVAFRVGHSMLDDDIERFGADGNVLPAGNLPLKNAFFNPGVISANGGIDPILRGFTTRVQQSVDLNIVGDIRNFLFGPPGAGGMDLAALDIQRGRDHGLADYNTMRQDFGLPKVTTFAQITADPAIAAQLQHLYGNVDNIDAFVGCLAEDHLAGSSVGPLTSAVIVDQFRRSRDGDRFFYLVDPNLSASDVSAIGGFKFSDLIRRNTFVRNIQDNAFVAGSSNLGPSWKAAAGGSWQTSSNWTGGLPNGAGAFATFQTSPTSAASVSLDAPITVGSLQLSNTNGISITPGAGGSLRFDNLGSSAAAIVTVGSHSISAPIALTDSLTILYQGSGALTISSSISEDFAGRSITIDGSFAGPTGGGTTTLSAPSTFTGGVSITHSLVNLNNASAQGPAGSTASASNNGEIVLGFTPTPAHRFTVGDLGAIRGDNSQMPALSTTSNLTLASGAMIVRQTVGGALPSGLGNAGNYYAAYTSNVSGANASITVGASGSTAFKGIGADRSSSYSWGTTSDTLTLAGNADLVALGGSTLTIPARITGGAASDTLTKRGTGTVKLTNVADGFAASNLVVQSGSLQLAYGVTVYVPPTMHVNVNPGATLSFSDGNFAQVLGTVVNNGAIVKPQGTATQLVFNGPALTGSGTLLAQDGQVGNSGSPNFIQTPTSTILAHAILFNNGATNFIGGVGGLDPNTGSPIIAIDGASTAVHLTGRWDGDGTAQNSWLLVNNGAKFYVDAGAAIDTISDTGGLRSFSGRGDGSGTVDFADGFVANQTDEVPGVVEFYVWSPGNFTWISRNSLNFPDSNIEVNQEDGGKWIVATHDQTAVCGMTTSRSFTIETQANLTLAKPAGAWAVFDGTKTITKIGPGTMTIAGENATGSGPTARIMSAIGSTLKVNGGHFVEMTDMGQCATGAGANGVFGPAGLPDADDVITTDYRWNVAVSNAGSDVQFNASQHLLSLKINTGGVVNLNNFVYGNGTHTTMTVKTLGTDSGAGTLNLLSGNSATATTAFSIAASSTFQKTGAGTLNVQASTTFAVGSAMIVQGGVVNFNLPSGSTSTIGAGTQTLSVSPGASLTVTATNRDPLSDQTVSSQRVNLANDGQFSLLAGSAKAGTLEGAGNTTTSANTTLNVKRVRQGVLSVGANGVVSVQPDGSNNGASRLTTLALAGAANPTSKFDLANNALVIDYSGATPFLTHAAQIKKAFNGGNWAGNGITSSTAATTAGRAIGIAEATDLFNTFPSTFVGQPVDSTAVLIRYTLAADTNLDGTVDFTDLLQLSQHYGLSGTWNSGDANYDQVVDFSDVLLLAQNYGQSLPADLSGGNIGDWATLSSVPEPASLALTAGLTIVLANRNRRRRNDPLRGKP